jgi:hypothetical protein
VAVKHYRLTLLYDITCSIASLRQTLYCSIIGFLIMNFGESAITGSSDHRNKIKAEVIKRTIFSLDFKLQNVTDSAPDQ